jgi:hypothetical protein
VTGTCPTRCALPVAPGGEGFFAASMTSVYPGNKVTVAQHVLSDPVEDPASVLPFDWPWDIGETIWPCRHCLPWRAELLLVEPDDAIWVREWHAFDCPIWAEIDGLEAEGPTITGEPIPGAIRRAPIAPSSDPAAAG